MDFLDAARAANLRPSKGKKAMEKRDRQCISISKPAALIGSVNIDDDYAKLEPNESRWDYGVGLFHSVNCAVWIERHGATSTGEVEVVIKKVDWLKKKLSSPNFAKLAELTENSRRKGINPFCWVVTGSVCFAPNTPQSKQLAGAGIKLAGKHLRVP